MCGKTKGMMYMEKIPDAMILYAYMYKIYPDAVPYKNLKNHVTQSDLDNIHVKKLGMIKKTIRDNTAYYSLDPSTIQSFNTRVKELSAPSQPSPDDQ